MKKILPLLAVLAIGITSVKAAVIITNSSAATFTVSNTDLLQTALSSTTTVNNWNVGRGPFMTAPQQTTFNGSGQAQGEPTLHNGIWENYTTSTPNSQGIGGAGTGNGYVVSYGFDLTASPLGYSITQIDLYSNWTTATTRDNILVTIDFSLLGTPTTFDQNIVTAATYAPTAGKGKMSISLTDSNIANSVAAIRFTFPSTQENNAVGYSEIDVFGTAIPEPNVAALLGGLGTILLLRRRRL